MTLEASDLEKLSPREKDILLRLSNGAMHKEVAGDLGLSTRTIEKHMERARRKLGVKRIMHAYLAINRWGLV